MSQFVLEVEDEFQPLIEAFPDLMSLVRAQRAAMTEGTSVDYEQTEQQVAQGAVERVAHAVLLSALDIDEPQVVIGEERYRRVLRSVGTYYTMAGPVHLLRTLYRPVGMRRKETVDTASLRAGVVGEGWLPHCAETMAWECQRAHYREAEEAGERWQRLSYSRSAFDRVTHLVGALFQKQREVVERTMVESTKIPDGAHSISVSLDRVSIPMEEPRQGPQGNAEIESERNAETESEWSPIRKAPKLPVQRVFRMAYAATVTLHDASGSALHTLRYGRMPQGDIYGLCTALCDDVLTLLGRCPSLQVVLLCEGAKELWNRLGAEFTQDSIGHPVHRLVDMWHHLEKLGSAARLLYGEQEGSQMLAKWRLKLLNESDGVEQILSTLKQSGKESVRSGDSRPVHEAITYLENHRVDMRYQSARQLGLPIGSGNVEATCKSLFEVRLKRPGCRWKADSGAHIVDLHALALSDRYAQALSLALAPLRTVFSVPPSPHTKLSFAG